MTIWTAFFNHHFSIGQVEGMERLLYCDMGREAGKKQEYTGIVTAINRGRMNFLSNTWWIIIMPAIMGKTRGWQAILPERKARTKLSLAIRRYRSEQVGKIKGTYSFNVIDINQAQCQCSQKKRDKKGEISHKQSKYLAPVHKKKI
jgi:hypothetical protein